MAFKRTERTVKVKKVIVTATRDDWVRWLRERGEVPASYIEDRLASYADCDNYNLQATFTREESDADR